jgi:hypothetical protein
MMSPKKERVRRARPTRREISMPITLVQFRARVHKYRPPPHPKSIARSDDFRCVAIVAAITPFSSVSRVSWISSQHRAARKGIPHLAQRITALCNGLSKSNIAIPGV